jgi:hypothetical protein
MAASEQALQSKNTPIRRADEWLARRAQRPQSEAIRDGVEMAIDALSKAIRESVREAAKGCDRKIPRGGRGREMPIGRGASYGGGLGK